MFSRPQASKFGSSSNCEAARPTVCSLCSSLCYRGSHGAATGSAPEGSCLHPSQACSSLSLTPKCSQTLLEEARGWNCAACVCWAGQGRAATQGTTHPQPLELPAKVSGSWGKTLLVALLFCFKARRVAPGSTPAAALPFLSSCKCDLRYVWVSKGCK